MAEGVETAEQLAMLRQMGCDFAQGYHLSRPLGLEPLHEWLMTHVPAVLERPEVPAGGGPSMTNLRGQVADGRDRVADGRDQSGRRA